MFNLLNVSYQKTKYNPIKLEHMGSLYLMTRYQGDRWYNLILTQDNSEGPLNVRVLTPLHVPLSSISTSFQACFSHFFTGVSENTPQ